MPAHVSVVPPAPGEKTGYLPLAEAIALEAKTKSNVAVNVLCIVVGLFACYSMISNIS